MFAGNILRCKTILVNVLQVIWDWRHWTVVRASHRVPFSPGSFLCWERLETSLLTTYECSKSVQVLMRNSKQTLDSNRVLGTSGIFDANPSNRSIILIQIRHTLPKRLPRKLRSRTPSIPPKQVAGLRAPQAFKYTSFHFFNVIAHQNQARFLEPKDPRRSGDPERSKISKES